MGSDTNNNNYINMEKTLNYLESLHKKECIKTGQKIPQTLEGKKLRNAIKCLGFINN